MVISRQIFKKSFFFDNFEEKIMANFEQIDDEATLWLESTI